MRFYTIELEEKQLPAVSLDGGASLYTMEALGLPFEDMNALIMGMTAEQSESIAERAASAAPLREGSYRLLSPIVHPRDDILCLGVNFYEHARESARFHNEEFREVRPYTVYFVKRVITSPGTGSTIPSHSALTQALDYEVELAVILRDEVAGVSEGEALSHVFGYTVFNDISARDLQNRHKQWFLGKSLDGFAPMGPCIVTPDELGAVYGRGIRSIVNGELRQSSDTGLMIRSVEGAIAELSAGMTLRAGTIIAMGTPAGVGMGFTPPRYLRPGDHVACEIDGIGRLEVTIGE